MELALRKPENYPLDVFYLHDACKCENGPKCGCVVFCFFFLVGATQRATCASQFLSPKGQTERARAAIALYSSPTVVVFEIEPLRMFRDKKLDCCYRPC